MHSKSVRRGIIKVQVTVIEKSEIEVVTLKNLDINERMARDGIISVSAQTQPEAGEMKVLGIPDAHFRVRFIPYEVIGNSQGIGTITIRYELFGSQGNLQQTSDLINAEEHVLRTSKLGEYFFWVGGIIDISKAGPGTYSGEFTIDIEYL